jgi:ATP/maltotriose-dependent transcriptional regulator MalT
MRVFQAQGMLYIALNKPKEAEGALWQLHQLALEVGDLDSQAFALQMVGYLRSWGEQIHESISLQERAVNLYITVGNPFRAAVLEQMLGASYLVLGDMELAGMYTQRGLERAKLYGVRQRIGWFYWTQAGIAGNQGDWEEGLSYMKMALREAEAIKEVRLKPLILVAKAMLLFKRGDWIEAEYMFLESCQAAVAVDWYPCTLALYGYFLAVTGRQTEAIVQLDRAASLPPPRGTVGRFYFPFLAEGYLHLGLVELVEFYLQYIRTLHDFIYYGNSVDRILGVIFAHKGDWETAEYYFEEGLALCRRANHHPEEAAILYEQARVAVLRRLPLPHIAALCEQARAIFLRYNMRRAVAMVDTLYNGARQLEHQVGTSLSAQAPTFSRMISSEPSLSEVLTKRELDVLRLITSGHTDREVVERLLLTPRTVNRHLSNIFAKLEVADRNAAVACAIRFGL